MNTENKVTPAGNAATRSVLFTDAKSDMSHLLAIELITNHHCRVFWLIDSIAQKDHVIRQLAKATHAASKPQIKDADMTFISAAISQPSCGISDMDIQYLKAAKIDAIWHSLTCIELNEYYIDELYDMNINGTLNIVDLATTLKVNEFNYLAPLPGEINDPEGPKTLLTECMEIATEILLTAGSLGSFQVRILEYPTLVSDNDLSASNEYITFTHLLRSIGWFKTFITQRVHDYFDYFPLKLLLDKRAVLNIVPMTTLIDTIVSITLNPSAANEHHRLKHHSLVRITDLIDTLKELFPGINFAAAGSPAEMSAVDNALHAKLKFAYRLFISESDNSAQGIIVDQATLRRYLIPIKRSLDTAIAAYESAADTIQAGMDKKDITCRFGETLTYYKTGSGPAIIIANALGVDIDAWKYLITDLAKSYTVYIWECRGLKNICTDKHPAGIIFNDAERANDILEVVTHENIDSAHLIGYCSGATEIILFQHHHPEYVKTLSLITGEYIEDDEIPEIKKKNIEMTQILLANPNMAPFFVQYLTDNTPININLKESQDIDTQKVLEIMNPNFRAFSLKNILNNESLLNYCKFVIHHDNIAFKRQMVEAVSVPSLVMAGQFDHVIHPRQSKWASKMIPDVRYINLRGGSHYIVMESWFDVAKAIRTFLSSQK